MTASSADIELQTGSEFCVSGCYGLTPAGEEFIDAYIAIIPGEPGEVVTTVVDAGRIVIPDACIPRFREKVAEAGLVLAETKATV